MILLSDLQTTICLCTSDGCNGPGLPPKNILESDDPLIEVERIMPGVRL